MSRQVWLLLLLLVGTAPFLTHAHEFAGATVYYNEACRDCTRYIREDVLPLLGELGIESVELKDFINEPSNRTELVERSSRLGISPDLQGHLSIFLDERVILQGHVPAHLIRDAVGASDEAFDRILLYQDKMAGMNESVEDYKAWAFAGPVNTYAIDQPLSTYLGWFSANREGFAVSEEDHWDVWTWLPLILGTGLLDGVNPCAFAVLLFFIAFLFTVHRIRAQVLKVGFVYIAVIYLTYLAIGLGLLQAIVITDVPHFMAKAGSWLLIGLGIINIKDFFWYGKGITLSPSRWFHDKSMNWLQKATMPATIVGGFLVGLCTFPCSGGVYVAVLGLLSAKTTYAMGLGYLLLYNVMFVLPLIGLLLVTSNRRTVGQIMRWETQHKRTIKLALGSIMVALGGSILLWFV